MVNKVVIYVEGGGDSSILLSMCRKGFSKFIERAGLKNHLPRIVACGSRNNAYDRFKCACEQKKEYPVLLVDSEDFIDEKYANGNESEWQPWKHVKCRVDDNWEKPENAKSEQCHFMVVCMESWLLCDCSTLEKFYGQGFNKEVILKLNKDIEKANKKEIYEKLKNATKCTKTKGEYNKGKHSFEFLSLIDPEKVMGKSKWAKRFIEFLKSIVYPSLKSNL